MGSGRIAKNIFFGSVYKVISIAIKFVLRTFLIKGLGDELVGLNTVISDWMSMLNLATLGIEIAIQFSLYRPIAENDIVKIQKIVRSSQIVYRKIGGFILLAGVILMPAFPHLIKENVFSYVYIYGAYMLMLFGVSGTYLFYDKRIVLQAHEDVYIANIVDIVCESVCIILQILVVIWLHSLYLFIVLGSLQMICQHSIVAIVCNKKYKIPKLKKRDREEERKIVSDLKDVAPLKLANYIYGYTDNVLISKFVGLSAVTVYSNYMLIVNAFFGISTMIVNATKSFFGLQLNVKDNLKAVRKQLEKYIFFQYIFAAIGALSFYILIDVFVGLWLGEQYVVAHTVVVIMSIEIFARVLYQPLQMIFEATGKFQQDKKITVMSAIINISISLIMVNFLGMIGPIIGTLITDIFIWVYRFKSVELEYFEQKVSICIKKWIGFSVTFLFDLGLGIIWKRFLRNYISGFGYLVLSELGILAIFFILFVMCFRKNENFEIVKVAIKKVYKGKGNGN